MAHGLSLKVVAEGVETAQQLAFLKAESCDEEALILIAGRYEGIDERFIDAHVDEEWSIGDYVTSVCTGALVLGAAGLPALHPT